MIKSMTGYGRAVETVNGREFTVEVRSVNNRYLDCSVKLPRSVSFAEETVKQAVKQSVSRGKVDVFITIKSETSDDTKITLNTSVLEGYLAAMRQMVAEFGVRDDISVSSVDPYRSTRLIRCIRPDGPISVDPVDPMHPT